MAKKEKEVPVVKNDAIVPIPIKDVTVVKDWNVRLKLTDIPALAASISKDGQRQPGTVYQDPEAPGKYFLVEGHRRLAACKRAGVSVFLARVADESSDPAEGRWFNLLENIHRNSINGFEQARGFYDYAVKANLPKRGRGTQISIRLGMGDEGKGHKFSPAQVNNLLRAYEHLCPKANQAWAEGKLRDETAFSLAALPPDKQEEVLEQARAMTAAEFRNFLQQKEADEHDRNNQTTPTEDGPKPKKRPTPKQMKKAIAWARFCGYDDVEQVLKWAMGERKTMVFDDNTFNPDTWEPSDTE